MSYEGTVYRPWPEANSLLIQTTIGCTNNQCTFCNMFRDKRFRVRDLDDVFADVDEARRAFPRVNSIFLIDGNVLAVKTVYLVELLEKIKLTFPECSRISLYAGLNDLRRKSVEELKQLKQAGLSMAYVGLESGDSVVLERVKKGMTPEQAPEGMALAKEAGIEVLLSVIFGLGGRERSREHIVETTRLLNLMEPEELAPMALAIQPGTELEKQVEAGEFILPTPLQVLEEEKYLLENLAEFDCYYWGDHGNNITPMRGRLPEAREWFLTRIERAMTDPAIEQQEVLQTFAW